MIAIMDAMIYHAFMDIAMALVWHCYDCLPRRTPRSARENIEAIWSPKLTPDSST